MFDTQCGVMVAHWGLTQRTWFKSLHCNYVFLFKENYFWKNILKKLIMIDFTPHHLMVWYRTFNPARNSSLWVRFSLRRLNKRFSNGAVFLCSARGTESRFDSDRNIQVLRKPNWVLVDRRFDSVIFYLMWVMRYRSLLYAVCRLYYLKSDNECT